MTTPKPRTCRHCKNKYMPFNSLQKACSVPCSIELGKGITKKKVAAQAKTDRKRMAKRREALKPKQKWLSELQAVFNEYVRLRDRDDCCISCARPKEWSGQWHASHYYSRGHSSALRFNLWNVHKSCSICNSHLSGNIGEYTPRLIEKIGQDRFDYLFEHKSDHSQYSVEWIKRAIKIARKAVRIKKKRL